MNHRSLQEDIQMTNGPAIATKESGRAERSLNGIQVFQVAMLQTAFQNNEASPLLWRFNTLMRRFLFTVTHPFVTPSTQRAQHLTQQILFATPRTVRRHDTNREPSTFPPALQFGSFLQSCQHHIRTHTQTHTLRRSGQRSTVQCRAHWQNFDARTGAPHTSRSILKVSRCPSKAQVCCAEARRGQSLFARGGNEARWQRQSSFGQSPQPVHRGLDCAELVQSD